MRRGQAWEVDGRPEHIRAACEASLRALETDVIDLYQFHRPDPDVPYAESVGAFKELQDEGKVRWVGISNATTEQLDAGAGDRRGGERAEPARARLHRSGDPRRGRRVRGAGDRVPALVAARRHRQRRRNADVGPVQAAAERHGTSPQQVALAWLLALSPVVVPIPGASRPETIADSARAAELELSADELHAISAAVGVA